MRFQLHHFVLALVTAFTILFAMPMASSAGDDEATRLERRGRAERYTRATTSPKNSIDTGGAAIYVNAPIDVVRRVVTDYRNYEKVIKPFKQSKLLSRNKGVSEVYLEVPILHGAATVWVVAKIGSPVVAGNEETITARMLRGNVDDFRAVWRLRAVYAGLIATSLMAAGAVALVRSAALAAGPCDRNAIRDGATLPKLRLSTGDHP